MVHGDDKGLIIPPRVAETQVVIVPTGITASTSVDHKMSLYKEVDALEEVLKAQGIRVISDKSEGNSPGWKWNEWEQKGVPLRLVFGPEESKGHFVTTSRRDVLGKDGKSQVPISDISAGVRRILESIQGDLYDRARNTMEEHTKQITSWDDFVPSLNEKNINMIPHCLTEECEDQIKKLSARTTTDDAIPEDEKAPSMGAKSLCIPYRQPTAGLNENTSCLNPGCTHPAKKWCLFGRSY